MRWWALRTTATWSVVRGSKRTADLFRPLEEIAKGARGQRLLGDIDRRVSRRLPPS
jgi:hypothetical protein